MFFFSDEPPHLFFSQRILFNFLDCHFSDTDLPSMKVLVASFSCKSVHLEKATLQQFTLTFIFANSSGPLVHNECSSSEDFLIVLRKQKCIIISRQLITVEKVLLFVSVPLTQKMQNTV